MDAVVIRDLSLADLPNIGWSGPDRHVQYVRDTVEAAARGEGEYLAALVGDDIVGLCAIDYVSAIDGGKVWQFTVHPDWRSKGIGSALLSECEHRIKAHGRRRAYFSVERQNVRAIALYERSGYVAIGEGTESWEDTAPDGSLFMYTADCILMEKTL